MRTKRENRRLSRLFGKYQENNNNLVRKILILGIGLIIFGLSTQQAQDFKFGAKVGVNFATDTGDGEFDTGVTARTGILLGGVAQLGIHEKVALQGDLLYSRQGFKNKVTHTWII
ncbi:MAG: hypothetical protein WBM98_09980 [Maribacter sp.]|uniref:hypothetical protein n=1 Tax=Maribacter sp. TaxID=1897614 RepID=UPI003C7631A9